MSFPTNVSPIGSPGPFGVIEMGGMFTILKVRAGLTSYADPGWYQHLPGTVAEPINPESSEQSREESSKGKMSWFSREGSMREPTAEQMNWMESEQS